MYSYGVVWQSVGAGDDDWEVVCSVETIATKYSGDAVATYARLDKILAKYKSVVDATMSPYPRPTAKVGVAIMFHIDNNHAINIVEGAYPPSLLCSAETPCHDSVPRL